MSERPLWAKNFVRGGNKSSGWYFCPPRAFLFTGTGKKKKEYSGDDGSGFWPWEREIVGAELERPVEGLHPKQCLDPVQQVEEMGTPLRFPPDAPTLLTPEAALSQLP